MRLHYFQHEPFEGLACIEQWATSHKYTITSTHFYKGEPLPSLDEIDVLVIMGGAMSVNDEKELAWLAPEKQFVKQAIDSGKVVVGICLGAQMIASVLGAKVYPNKEKEIGWFPIQWENRASLPPAFATFPDPLTVLHWHGETFDLPTGAIRIARSEGCLNQGFLYQHKVLGLQFHLEFDHTSTGQMLLHCAEDLKPGNYVQTAEEIAEGSIHITAAQDVLFRMLTALVS